MSDSGSVLQFPSRFEVDVFARERGNMGIELSRALEEIALVIAKLRFIEAQLQRARQDELKGKHEQAASEEKK